MKSKSKSSHIKRARGLASHKTGARRRPLHKQVLLHPFSAFVLLCVGVLVAGSSFRSQASSYDVTATVPAPAITTAAVITAPVDGLHVTAESVGIVGDCPAQSYVKLFVNSTFGGVAACESGHFSVQTSLSYGANKLQAHVFNHTDVEGPESPSVTVYRNLPVVVVPPAEAPVNFQVSYLEQDGYKKGIVQEVGSNPTVSGLAPPLSDITVTFYSDPSVCKTKADSRGVWSCTLPVSLPPGVHQVVIVATTITGQKLTMPTFKVKVVENVRPFVIVSDYHYLTYHDGQTAICKMAMSGGKAPYSIHVDWGDGSTEQVTRLDQAEFDLEHAYRPTADRSYAVMVRAVDARGETKVLQTMVVVKKTVPLVSAGPSRFATIITGIEQWLWVIWPAYIGVVLMAISFWIGEQEGYRRLLARKRTKS